MIPILYSKNATTFASNGIGRLNCISCEVVEEANGQYELTMTIAEDTPHASAIEMGSIIVAKPSQGGSNQPFRVYQITKPINGKFSVFARHVSYQLSYIPTTPFSIAASWAACGQTLAALKTYAAESCPFTFQTDVTTVAGFVLKKPLSIRSCIGGVEGSVLDTFGGELEWDGYTVRLHAHRGVTTPTVTLRYGKNITDISQEESIANTITGVCPFWVASDDESNMVMLPEQVVESQYADLYPFRRTVVLDCSDKFEEAPSALQLRTYAQAYVNSAGIGIPTVSVKVSFIDLSETEEYKDIMQLQSVNLCDRINVVFEKLGINTTAKVVKTDYDVLAERYNSIEVGSIRSSLATTISDTNGAIEIALGKAIFATQNATAWLTSSNGYVHAVKNSDGTWKELIFADTDDPTTWHNLLRVNENGFGFSHDGGLTYSQAWTLDGAVVIGGTAAPSLTVYDSNNNILFQIDRDGLEWNATYSSMTKDGAFSAQNATISGTLETEGDDDTKAVLESGGLGFYYNNTLEANIKSGISGGLSIDTDDFHVSGDFGAINCDNAASGIEISSSTGDILISAYDDMTLVCDDLLELQGDRIVLNSDTYFSTDIYVNNNDKGINASVYVRLSNGNVGLLTFQKGILTAYDDNV